MESYYKNLIVWQKSFALAQEIYTLTKDFPSSEQYGIVDQMRRSSVSIPSNIAEGSGRGSNIEYKRFLHIAKGSACELETQTLLSISLGFLDGNRGKEVIKKIEEILRMLSSLIQKFQNKNPS